MTIRGSGELSTGLYLVRILRAASTTFFVLVRNSSPTTITLFNSALDCVTVHNGDSVYEIKAVSGRCSCKLLPVEQRVTGPERSKVKNIEAPSGDVQQLRIEAASAPHVPTWQLARTLKGNFKDLETLLDQLAAPPLIELGKPLPNDKFIPRPTAGRCPAAHNRALLDKKPD